METTSNPLKKYQRQPKLFVDLPSKGVWYDSNLVTKFEDLEVYSMTASDEIAIKTPDALFTGNTVKSIIENCIPSIKDAWSVCSVDLEYLLASIRLASYGESISMKQTCGSCKNEDTYAYPLQNILDHLQNIEPSWVVSSQGFTFRLRPLSYKEIVENNQSNMKVSRALRKIVSTFKDDDPEQGNQVDKLYDELNEKTKDAVCKIIVDVVTPDGNTETNPNFIKDFLLNDADPIIFKDIQAQFIKNNELFAIPKTEVECSECGFKSHILPELDYSNFFSNS